MSTFHTRLARPADRAAIARMWRRLMEHHRALDPRFTIAADGESKYERHVLEMIRASGARVVLAECSTTAEAVGYIMGEVQQRPPLTIPGRFGFVSEIYISDVWRGRGVGRALYADVRRWFVEQKVGAIEMYVAENNPAAQAFWNEMGLGPFLRLLHEDL